MNTVRLTANEQQFQGRRFKRLTFFRKVRALAICHEKSPLSTAQLPSPELQQNDKLAM